MKHNRIRESVRALFLGTIGLLVVACGSSAKSTSATTSGSTADTGSSETSASTSAPPVGSTSGEPSLSSSSTARAGQTINVELVTTDKGSYPFPQFGEGEAAAVDYVNSHGGVNGAKITLHMCSTDSTPEGSIACTNTAIDKHVVVDSVALDFALDASVPKIEQAGIPVVMDLPAGTLTAASKDVTVLSSSAPSDIAGAFAYFAKQSGLRVRRLAVVAPDSPAARQTQPSVTVPVSRALGIPIDIYYLSQSSPDYNSIVLALKSSHADYVLVPLPEGQCTSLVATAKSLGFTGHLIMSGCSQYIATDGAAAVGTYLTSTVYPYLAAPSAPPSIKPDLQLYAQAMSTAGFPTTEIASGDSLVGFAGMANLIYTLDAIPSSKPLTASSVLNALHAAKFIGFDGLPIDCTGTNSVKTDTNACSSTIPLIQVAEAGANPTLVPVGTGVFDVGPFLRTVPGLAP